ncbi:MAG: M23 family metallopeptidase [Microbacterium sp.]
MRITARLCILVCFSVLLWAGTAPTAARTDDGVSDHASWLWPIDGSRDVVSAYRAPANKYGAGHRGIDIAAPVGASVRAPADGVVAFRGTVVDRGVLTIEHPGGYVTTFEPIRSELSPGHAIAEGDDIGFVDIGGHAIAGTLHVGVRLDGEYINPRLLFGNMPRAVLLPCCEPL